MRLLFSIFLLIPSLASAETTKFSGTERVCEYAKQLKLAVEQAKAQQEWFSKCIPRFAFETNNTQFIAIYEHDGEDHPRLAPADVHENCDILYNFLPAICDLDAGQILPTEVAK